jgi:hypothetical protein
MTVRLAIRSLIRIVPVMTLSLAHAQVLSNCTSDSFNQINCEREIADMERQYPEFSAPDNVVEKLAAAYHNMAYVSPVGLVKTTWQDRERKLFNAVVTRAKTSANSYLASRIAPNTDFQIGLLRTALLSESGNLAARRDLADIYITLHLSNEALTEWSLIRASKGFSAPADGTRALRLANGLVTSGNVSAAKEIASDIVVQSRNMEAFSRCHLLGVVNAIELHLDPSLLSEVQKTRSTCTNFDHWNRGVRALKDDDEARAATEFESQIRENPHHVGGYILLEEVYRSMKNVQNGIAVLKRLFASEIDDRERCEAVASIPLDAYAARDPEFVQQMRRQCAQSGIR